MDTTHGGANPYYMTPEDLIREVEELTRTVASGRTEHAQRLAELARGMAKRLNAPYSAPSPDVTDPALDLMFRVGHRPRALPAGEVRAARPGSERGPDADWLAALFLATLPAPLPAQDDALVVVYTSTTPGTCIFSAVKEGDERAVQECVINITRRLT
ncbi:hypothetical protein [Streptomyces umbrinus]|uniref:hypothetical protein n=1 Tax=Streptomyces umbrinus TaxID=67370 RepID=UPI003C2B05FB